jgi:hypothetical protein
MMNEEEISHNAMGIKRKTIANVAIFCVMVMVKLAK